MQLKSSKNFTSIYQFLILNHSHSDKVWVLSSLKDLLCDFSSQNVYCDRFIFFPATIKKKKKVEFAMLNVSYLSSLYLFFLGLWFTPIQEKKKKSGIFSFTTFRRILENCLMLKNIYWPVHVHIYLSAPCNVLSAT